MPPAYSRVTVVNDARRVDLALPSALPLTELMPHVLGFCAPEGQPEHPVGWTLGRVGGANISLTSTLAAASVVDGDVLELRTEREAGHVAHVEDVRDVLEDTVDEAGRQWQRSTTISTALVTSSVGLALATVLPQAREPRAVAALWTAMLVSVLLVFTGWWSARRGHTLATHVVIAVAILWGAVAGWIGATFPGWPPAAAAGSALAGGLLAAALARAVTPIATAHLAALCVLSVAGAAVGAAELAGIDPLVGVRVTAVGAILLVGALPRASLTVGGLASADYRVRNHGLVTSEELAHRIARSTALLHGGLVGAAAVGLASGVLLARSDSPYDQALSAVVGLALVLRSRVFSRIGQVLPLRLAGVAVLTILGLLVVDASEQLRPKAAIVAVAAAFVLVAVSAVPLSDVARARVKQLLNWLELVVVVTMLTVAAAALGVFDWVAELTSN